MDTKQVILSNRSEKRGKVILRERGRWNSEFAHVEHQRESEIEVQK